MTTSEEVINSTSATSSGLTSAPTPTLIPAPGQEATHKRKNSTTTTTTNEEEDAPASKKPKQQINDAEMELHAEREALKQQRLELDRQSEELKRQRLELDRQSEELRRQVEMLRARAKRLLSMLRRAMRQNQRLRRTRDQLQALVASMQRSRQVKPSKCIEEDGFLSCSGCRQGDPEKTIRKTLLNGQFFF